MTQITRRGVLAGAVGVGSLALLGSQWPRLNGTDIPGRHDDSLSIAILGTNQDAEARQSLVKAFNTHSTPVFSPPSPTSPTRRRLWSWLPVSR